jgi:C4-dicarboxylate transporter, DcuC family
MYLWHGFQATPWPPRSRYPDGPMTVALCLLAMMVAFALIRRGFDVRPVLFGTALGIGAIVGQVGVVFRRMAEALTDAKYVLPICGAMGFAYVVRETGCVDDLVSLLLRPLGRLERLVLPGSSTIAFIVNTALPSQTSTLATVGPLSVDLMKRLGSAAGRAPSAVCAGSYLVLGASIAGELLNPGVAQVVGVARSAGLETPQLVVWLVPAAFAALFAAMGALYLHGRIRPDDDDPRLANAHVPATEDEGPRAPARFTPRAILPLLPILWLMAGHPSLPSKRLVAAVTPDGLEVITAMLAGVVLTIAVAARDRSKATRAMLDGMGFAFAHIVTLIAVSAGIAKALEVAGVLFALVSWAGGHSVLALALVFLLAFSLGVLSGSGVGPSVALVTALGPRAAELGVHPLALGGARCSSERRPVERRRLSPRSLCSEAHSSPRRHEHSRGGSSFRASSAPSPVRSCASRGRDEASVQTRAVTLDVR